MRPAYHKKSGHMSDVEKLQVFDRNNGGAIIFHTKIHAICAMQKQKDLAVRMGDLWRKFLRKLEISRIL